MELEGRIKTEPNRQTNKTDRKNDLPTDRPTDRQRKRIRVYPSNRGATDTGVNNETVGHPALSTPPARIGSADRLRCSRQILSFGDVDLSPGMTVVVQRYAWDGMRVQS